MTDIDAGRPLPSIPPRIRGGMAARSGTFTPLHAFHPIWWVALAAIAAWYVVFTTHAQPSPAPHAHHAAHGAASEPVGMDVVGLWVMTIAMMLPLTLGWVREVARSTSARHRATAAFLAGYLAVWMIAIVLIGLAWQTVASYAGRTGAIRGVVVLAIAWEIAAAVHHGLRRCDESIASVASGWRAYVASVRLGAAAGGRCLLSCWALMAACVAFAHSIWAMVILFGVQLIGRYRPIRITRRGGAHHPHSTHPAGAPVR